MKTRVVSHVTLVMSLPVVSLGPVRVMEVGVAMRPHVVEVTLIFVYAHIIVSNVLCATAKFNGGSRMEIWGKFPPFLTLWRSQPCCTYD